MSRSRGRREPGASRNESRLRVEIADEPAVNGPERGRTGLARIARAAGYSLAGLRAAIRSETAFRQEVGVAVVLLPLAFWVGQSWVQTALLIGSLFLVLIVELLNSAIEAAVDRVSLDRHELSKRAKDFASAAVFLALLLCAGLWSSALWQRAAGWLSA